MIVTFSALDRFSRWEIFQFLYDSLSFAEGYEAEVPQSFTIKLQELRTAFDIYDIELVQEQKASSERLLKEDNERNFAIRKIYSIVRTYSNYHYDPEKMQAAKYLQHVFKYYGTGSRISRMNQDAKTGLLNNLLQDLAKPQAEGHLSILHLTDAVTALTLHNDVFENEQQNRRNAKSEFVTGVAREARLNVQNAYLAFAEMVNALAILEGPEKYAELKQFLNVLFKRYVAQVRQRTKRKKKVEM